MIRYENSSLIENGKYLEMYVDGIPLPYDDFLEEHILKSSIFSVFYGEQHIGFFGKLEDMATIFYIKEEHFEKAWMIFEDIKGRFKIREAFVPTTDLGFMSVALEKYSSLEIQALHFTETNRTVRPPEFSQDHLRLAVIEDLQVVEQLAGNFLDKYAERINDNTFTCWR